MPYEKTSKGIRCIADEIPFEIPDSWEWVCLEQICEYIQRGKSPKYSPIKKYPVIAQKCNQWSGFSIEKAQFIAPETIEAYSPERFLRDRDLLWNSTGLGTLGRMAIYKNELNPYGIAVADSHVTVIRLSALVLPEFFFLYFANPSVQSVIEEQADGTTKQKELSRNTVRSYWTPLPPLAEQKRIVAKIEELVPHLEEYSQAETRIKKLNTEFPELLKKSILQWAIQGKLVPQNPDDEPASVLLERIRAEKAKLVKAGKIKKDKVESVIFRRDNSHYTVQDGKEVCLDDTLPFDIPLSWSWVKLKELLEQASTGPFGSMLHKSDYVDSGVPLVNPANIVGTQISDVGIKKVSVKTAEELRSYKLFPGDVIIGRRGELGRSAVVPDNAAGWLCGTGCFFVTTNATLLPAYLVFLLASPYIREALLGKAVGTTMNNLNHGILGDLLVPLPPKQEQHRILMQWDVLIKRFFA